MIELKLPELGENIESAEVSRLLIAEGDMVQVDQNVLELESDKASFPLPSTHAGRVARIHVKVGDTVAIGQTLLEIEEAQQAGGSARPGKPPVAAAPSAAATPTRSASAAAADGEDQPKKEPGTPSREKKKSAKKEHREVEAGKIAVAEEKTETRPPAPAAQPSQAFVAAGPATRTLARELGVHIEDVAGHGPGGRVTREDVKAFVQGRLEDGPMKQAEADTRSPSSPLPALADFSQWGPVSRQRLSPLARAAAERLSLAWRVVPHVTQHDTADITELEAGRQRYNDAHRGARPKITATALAIRAAVAALKAFPRFNSSLDAATGELILKSYYHIGVAVDTDQGLLVPVLRDADGKSLVEVAAALAELAEKARARTLTKQEMEGGTFTISNLGGIGGTSFTPIVNYPEVAILGMSRAGWQLVADKDQTHRRLLLPLSLSYDHRVINGADAARFVVMVARLLSDPFQLMAEA